MIVRRGCSRPACWSPCASAVRRPAAQGQVPTLTSEQLEILRSLPPDQRDALIEQVLGSGQEGVGRRDSQLQFPETVLPRDSGASAFEQEQLLEEPRLRADDTLLLLLEIREFKGPDPVQPLPPATGTPAAQQALGAQAAPPAPAPRERIIRTRRGSRGSRGVARSHPGPQSVPARSIGTNRHRRARTDRARRPHRNTGRAATFGRDTAGRLQGRRDPAAARAPRRGSAQAIWLRSVRRHSDDLCARDRRPCSRGLCHRSRRPDPHSAIRRRQPELPPHSRAATGRSIFPNSARSTSRGSRSRAYARTWKSESRGR